MDYSVREVSLQDPAVRRGAVAVLRDAFGGDLTEEKLVRNTSAGASRPSLYVAAMIGEEIIGFNAFISHDLILNGQAINCYQSCWTGTSSLHRGKKIFQNLILSAHDILAARGAGFVFGFPNDASYPLFTKKLNYRELPALKWQMLNIPGARGAWLADPPPDMAGLHRDAVLQNDRQLIALKRGEYGADLLEESHEGSIAWGVRRAVTRRGVAIPYLDLGGFDLKRPDHLRPLLDRLRRKAGLVAYVQAVTIQGSAYNDLLARVAPSQSNCLIVFDLNLDSRDLAFNFFGGVRDVY